MSTTWTPAELERRLIRHAERYGAEMVVKTAAELLPAERVTAVERALVNRGLIAPPRRSWDERRADLEVQVVALRDRGLVADAIADALRVPDRQVRAILRAKCRKSPPGLLSPHGYAVNTARSGPPSREHGGGGRRGTAALSAPQAQLALDVPGGSPAP